MLLQQIEVAVQVPRVLVQVVFISELCRIHEDAYGHGEVVGPCFVN